jgi:DNA-binding CsgD family transcriptional regulator
MSSELEQGREAWDRRSWRSAHAALTAARSAEPLDALDLWRLALASYLIGREDDFLRALEGAHQAYLDGGEPGPALRCATWLGLHLANRGDVARATGWFGRATRLLGELEPDCAERGYALLPEGHRQIVLGDYEAASRTAAEAAAAGQRFGDRDLFTLALHMQGRALLRLGRVEEGLSLLDEAMVAVAADDLSPLVTGLVYCAVIGACREVFAVGRAQEWTAALTEWCAAQPDMVAYTGQCRVYRAEILRRRGAWRDAIEEARRACERFIETAGPRAAGAAHYQQGEAHRLLGEFSAAEGAYRAASRAGNEPQPGLALLRLAQGDGPAAAAAIRRALAETPDRHRRARLLPAHIEVMLAVGDVDRARASCAELEEIAGGCAPGIIDTMVAEARGAIALAEGDAEGALAPLRQAWREWRDLDAPYEAARARVLLGLACRALGDEEGAALELDAAREELERLGANPAVAGMSAATGGSGRAEHGLTPRERDVIALVATGRTNRRIAEALSISEKTVARHLSNIYGKLGISSRAAATAFAYEHELLDPPT